MNTSRRLCCAIGAILSLPAVGAESGSVAGETTLGRIAVTAEEAATAPVDGFVAKRSTTASKTDATLLEVPRAVSVVTMDEMRNRAADDLTDIFQYTAGINGDAYGGNSLSRTYSNARGFLSYQYLDGIKLHDSNWGIEPFGLERAELLKGPGSSLYGQGSPGGVINLTSKRPLSTRGGELALQGGSFSRAQGALDLAGPLGDSSTWSYRLTALARNADARVDHTQDDRYYFAPAVSWHAGDRTEITFLGSWQSDPNLTVFQYLPRVGTLVPSAYGYVPRDTFTGEPAFDDLSIDRFQLGFLLEHELSDTVVFRQNVRYTDLDIVARYLQAGAVAADQRTVSRTRVNSGFDIQVLQADNQLNFKAATGRLIHDVVAGLDYAVIPTQQVQGTGAGPTLDLYAPVYGAEALLPAITTVRDQDFRQLGLYVQDQVRLGMVSLVAGLRRDDASSDTDSRNPVTGVVTPTVRQDDEATTGQLGIALNFANGLAPYANFARSFQPTAGTDFFGASFVPSEGEQWEGGLKYQPRALDALFTIAVFDVVQENVRTNDLAHPGFAIQTGEISAQGVELEGRMTLVPALNLSAAYAWLDNEVTRSNTNNLNKRPPGRPRQQASLWVDYAFPFLRQLAVGAGIRYVGESYGDAANTFEVPSYTLVDALVRYDLGGIADTLAGWNLSANASNLGDKRYVVNCDAATQCFYGQGRVARLTVSRRW